MTIQWTQPMDQTARAMRLRGATWGQVAKRVGVSTSSLWEIRRRLTSDGRPIADPVTLRCTDQVAYVVRVMVRGGCSLLDIAARFEVTPDTAATWVRKLGLRTRRAVARDLDRMEAD